MFELLENNLFELMAANNYKGFPEEQIRIFAIQLLNSLDFMKKQKIIHCDIKPENIVLSKWGKSGIKIVDFGTSCFEGKQIY
jgi:dual specificity tyrosine-phosphorylation-regulated kinase 2/3/4